MKILFVSGLYSTKIIEQLMQDSNNGIQNAANVFQWNIVNGLCQNNINFEIVSFPFIPSFPLGYNRCFTPSDDIVVNTQMIGRVLSFCDLIIWKKQSIKSRLEKHLRNWIEDNILEDKLVILTYSPYVPFLKAIRNIKNKYPKANIEVVSIITDLVDDYMNSGSNRALRKIQCEIEKRETHRLYKYIDKFVLLSKHMIEKIPNAKKSYIVVEGLAQVTDYPIIDKNKRERTLLYTGLLDAFTGIADLICAFRKIKDSNIRLVICGSGPMSDIVKQAASEDARITFKGLVSREEAIALQQQATLLINPRKPDNLLTRYSFPSKTMEYLASGTPMLGYKLDGIPEEYYNYYYTIEHLDTDSLSVKIQEVLSYPQADLNKKAKDAHRFIFQQKTSKVQTKKIVDFIKKTN